MFTRNTISNLRLNSSFTKDFILYNEDNESVCETSVQLLISPNTVAEYTKEAERQFQLALNNAEANLAQKDFDALLRYNNQKDREFDKVYKKLLHLRNHVKQLETEAKAMAHQKDTLVKKIDRYKTESDDGAKIERFGPLFDLLKSTAKGRFLIMQQYGKLKRHSGGEGQTGEDDLQRIQAEVLCDKGEDRN